MEKGIILNGGERELQNIPHEVRHDSATTTSLRLKMSHIRHRHVVGKLKGIVPIKITIHAAGAESSSSVFSYVVVN